MAHHIDQLKHIIDHSERIIFFTGAGVSVASGVPDFRSMGGLFDEISKEGYSPEYLLSTNYLEDDPIGFMRFCHKRLLLEDKLPNPVHKWIAELEQRQHSLGSSRKILMAFIVMQEANMSMNYMAHSIAFTVRIVSNSTRKMKS